MFNKKTLAAGIVAACLTNVSASYAANPAITDTHTADPAALVHGDTVYLYVGNDEAKDNRVFYDLKKWLVYSSKDMVNWTNHGSPLDIQANLPDIQYAHNAICKKDGQRRLEEHRAIFDALAEHDSQKARIAMRAHFTRSLEALHATTEARAVEEIQKQLTQRRERFSLARLDLG